MRGVWISVNLALEAKPLTNNEVAGIRGFGLFLVAWSGLLAGAGSVYEASSFVSRGFRSMPTSLKSGFVLGSVAGWSWSSDGTKIQRVRRAVSSALPWVQSWFGGVASVCLLRRHT